MKGKERRKGSTWANGLSVAGFYTWVPAGSSIDANMYFEAMRWWHVVHVVIGGAADQCSVRSVMVESQSRGERRPT